MAQTSMGQLSLEFQSCNDEANKSCLVLFDLILYSPSTIFQFNRDESSLFEPVLS